MFRNDRITKRGTRVNKPPILTAQALAKDREKVMLSELKEEDLEASHIEESKDA